VNGATSTVEEEQRRVFFLAWSTGACFE